MGAAMLGAQNSDQSFPACHQAAIYEVFLMLHTH